MNNFIIVFRAIKENCNEAGAPNGKCYAALEKLVINKQLFLPLYLHLEVLQGLGLIEFSIPGKGINVTEKGKHTDIYSVFGVRIFILSVLYLLRYLLLLILFWPVLIMVPKRMGKECKKNSAG